MVLERSLKTTVIYLYIGKRILIASKAGESMVKEYFISYEQKYPEQRSELRRISLALRRNGIETMPELYQMYRYNRKQLLQIRSIGEKSVQLIGKLCSVYEMEISGLGA